ncbi:MAG TPA: sigma-70 family RNA polymerase sigma factor [Candidatus Acidoferrum sp.]|jgi:RNA polymerase sigma-70 factor (ECF subfamily)|nr:sigma-70 family RNA polymerase sigma factor [Candidatus Acidoferrum sp.]
MKIRKNDQDDELLKRTAKGDEDAFTILYRRHADVLYRFAFRMTGSSWGAEEIVQDVFMTLVREPGKYDAERGTLPAFLFGITRNKIMKYHERLPREVSLVERQEDGSGGGLTLRDSFTPAMWAEQRERLEKVRAAVMDLPIEFRETVVLCELEEMSYDQAARMLDCPIGTIRSRLHRGRALLLAKLEMLRDAPRRWSSVGR